MGAVELTLNLGVLILMPLQQVNPDAPHAQLPVPSQPPLPLRACCRVEAPMPPACCSPPSGSPAACLARTSSLSHYCGLPPPCFCIRRDRVAEALAVQGLGAQGNGEAGTKQGEGDGHAISGRLPPAGVLAREAEPTAPCGRAARR